jgi:hypothetical protein
MVLMAEEPFTSEGELALGIRLDQVIGVSRFPAQIGLSLLLEVRLEEGVDEHGVNVDLSLENQDFSLRLGSQFIPMIARGDDWPFPPDTPLVIHATVSVPAESEAYLTVRFNGQVVQTKWLRVVDFDVEQP